MSKTEQPTAQRIRRALREGDVPFSAVAVRTAGLAAAVAVLPAAARAIQARFTERLRAALDGVTPTPQTILVDVVTLAAPLVGAGAALALTIGLVQTGGQLTHRTQRQGRTTRGPTWSPFDTRRATRTALGIVVLVSTAAAALATFERGAPDLADTMPSARRALELASALVPTLAWTVLSILVVSSVVDYLFERRLWFSRLRMSREELADERREHEGDPDMRRARRRAHEAIVRGSGR
jgi:flagellar biosynthesis protein FlhB